MESGSTKKRNMWIYAGLFACIWCIQHGAADDCNKDLLLVSMDGFAWDYLEHAETPNFDKLATLGVAARYLKGTFATRTFPSHYTMATGLYQETHGIVGNAMYDPVFKEFFTKKSYDSKWWDGGEPIWITTRKQKKKSATFFWPGSEAELQGYRPNIWKTYNASVPFKDRVDEVVKWFVDKGINMATLYFHEPDRTGHSFGPDSQEVKLKVEYMDGVLGYLMNRFDEHNLWGSVNVIVTSDHGMAGIDLKNRLIDITDYVNMSMIKATIENGALMQILPSAGNLVDDIFNALHSRHPNMTVYKKEDIPQRWHYGDNRRVAPIVAVADLGWSITKNRTMAAAYAGYRRGGHGYDNEVESMRSIFLARGPSFKKNYSMEPFSSLDLYPLMCSLLRIHPAPNNGSLDVVSKMIIESPAICGGQKTIGHFGLLFSLFSLFTFVLY